MKKIINNAGKIFLALCAVALAGSFSSCKDNKDDFTDVITGYTGSEAELVGTWTGQSFNNSDPYDANNDAVTMVFTNDGKMVVTYKQDKDDKKNLWSFSGTSYNVWEGENDIWNLKYEGYYSFEPDELFKANDVEFYYQTLDFVDEYGDPYQVTYLILPMNYYNFRMTR